MNVSDVQKRTQLLKELETLMGYGSRFLVRSHGEFYDGEGIVHGTLEYGLRSFIGRDRIMRSY